MTFVSGVFVSHTVDDLSEYRLAAQQVLNEAQTFEKYLGLVTVSSQIVSVGEFHPDWLIGGDRHTWSTATISGELRVNPPPPTGLAEEFRLLYEEVGTAVAISLENAWSRTLTRTARAAVAHLAASALLSFAAIKSSIITSILNALTRVRMRVAQNHTLTMSSLAPIVRLKIPLSSRESSDPAIAA